MDMAPSNENGTQRQSEFGVASTFVGGAMLLVQLGILSAMFLGIKDNQGVIYAVAIPFVMYCIGVPLGLLAAVIGSAQPKRHRKYAMLGIVSTLAGPLLFAIFVAVQVTFHPW
jgi:FtsH-binding integral membrane protein